MSAIVYGALHYYVVSSYAGWLGGALAIFVGSCIVPADVVYLVSCDSDPYQPVNLLLLPTPVDPHTLSELQRTLYPLFITALVKVASYTPGVVVE